MVYERFDFFGEFGQSIYRIAMLSNFFKASSASEKEKEEMFIGGLLRRLLGSGVSVNVPTGGKKKKHKEVHNTHMAYDPGATATATGVVLTPTMKQKFDDVLANEFANYTVKENVAIAEVNPNFKEVGGWAYPYALYNGDKLACVVMITPQGKYRTKGFWYSQKAAQEGKVPFCNFLAHYPNEPTYVADRIKKFCK